MPAPGFNSFHLILGSCDYNMYVEGLLPATVCLLGTMFAI